LTQERESAPLRHLRAHARTELVRLPRTSSTLDATNTIMESTGRRSISRIRYPASSTVLRASNGTQPREVLSKAPAQGFACALTGERHVP